MKTIRFLAALPLLCAGLVRAHPNGTSKIAIHLRDPDSIAVTIDVNNDDLFSATRADAQVPKTPEADSRYRQQITTYLLNRVRFQADNAPIHLQPLRWKPGGQGPEDGFLNDSGSFWTGTRVVTYGGVLPVPSRILGVTVQLFPEIGVSQPISEISLYWRDSLVERKWLGLDRTLRLPVSGDSLAAMLQRAQAPAEERAKTEENLVARFIGLGFIHILPRGLDHILFVLGLFFFSTRMKPLLWQITAFTVAHSITLGLSLVGVFSLPTRVVEPLIALSIAVVGLENIFFRRMRASRWLIVFGFGLIHGMGFAGALRELGLPPGKFWSVLASFNLGVELGQLTVVTTAFLITRAFWNKPWYFRFVVVPVSAVISLTGLYWAAQRTLGF